MATKKKGEDDADAATAAATAAAEAYRALLTTYAGALETMRKGDVSAARDQLLALADQHPEEPELADRARTWAKICQRRMAGDAPEPADADEAFYRAVMLSNEGRSEEAIALLDRCIQHEPTSVRCHYARASAWALLGNTDRAVSDLRQAIAIDPAIRFQAVNDTDFEKIREEPAFIDIIEPTPTGA